MSKPLTYGEASDLPNGCIVDVEWDIVNAPSGRYELRIDEHGKRTLWKQISGFEHKQALPIHRVKKMWRVSPIKFEEVKDKISNEFAYLVRFGCIEFDTYTKVLAELSEGVSDYDLVMHQIDSGFLLTCRPKDRARMMLLGLPAYEMEIKYKPID